MSSPTSPKINTTSLITTTQSSGAVTTDHVTTSFRDLNSSLPVTAVTSQVPCTSVPLETIGAIAGGCSAAVVLLVLLGALCFTLLRRRRSKDKPGCLGQGCYSCSHLETEVRQENVQNADAESSRPQMATSLETYLMQPTYLNGCMFEKESSNRNTQLSSMGQEACPSLPHAHTEYAAIRSKRPEVLLVVEETAGPYTALRGTVNDLLNPYNTFEDFGDTLNASGKTSPNRMHVSEPSPQNKPIHISDSKPLSANRTHSVDSTYTNSAIENSKLNVYQNSHSVVSSNVKSDNGDTKNKKRKEKNRRKHQAGSESKNYKSGLGSEQHLEGHVIPSESSFNTRDIESDLDSDNKNVYRNDRVYSNYK